MQDLGSGNWKLKIKITIPQYHLLELVHKKQILRTASIEKDEDYENSLD